MSVPCDRLARERTEPPREDLPVSPRTRARASSGGLLAVGWLALAVVGRAALAAAPDGQEALGRLAAGSPAALALQHQPVVPDPAAAWHWAPVLATVRAQARQTAAVDAAALRRGLVDLAVLDAAGEPLPPGGTVARMLPGRAVLGLLFS